MGEADARDDASGFGTSGTEGAKGWELGLYEIEGGRLCKVIPVGVVGGGRGVGPLGGGSGELFCANRLVGARKGTEGSEGARTGTGEGAELEEGLVEGGEEG